ncbi:MAG: TrmH family RNA methyltransferase [Acidimicrobiales bacterium]
MTVPELITSSANPLVKRIRALDSRKIRKREGAFFLEGVQPVWRAIQAGAEVEVLVVAPELVADSFAQDLCDTQVESGTRVAYLSAELFGRISERKGPTGIAAVLLGRTGSLNSLEVTATSLFVALHEVSNPGNLGTIVRSADAAGAAGLLLLGNCADPFAPAAVKASMGSLYSLPIVAEPLPDEFTAWAHEHGLRLAATSAHSETPYWDLDLASPTVLLMGSEGAGLPAELVDRCDLVLQIPMVGSASSLNLAAATSIILFDVLRRRSSLETAGH